MRTMNASTFKAKCLAILDEVAATGDPVTILKRGKAVAQLVPPAAAGADYPQHELFGTVVVKGDVISPALAAEDWEVEAENLE